MKVLIVCANRNTIPMPVIPIGACIVAEAAERFGHTVRLLDLMFLEDAVSAVESAVSGMRPDVVGLSVRNIDNTDMRNPVDFMDGLREVADAVRAATGAPIVLGGPALGIMPEEILRRLDVSCGVVGDGETVFPLLLERISRGAALRDLPGVATVENGAYRAQPCADSAYSSACEAPDFERWLDMPAYRSRLATVPVRSKTGCAFRCVYCTCPLIEGSAYRLKDPGSVADAVARLAAAGHRDIEFVDSVFNAPREHAMNVCDALARSGHKARLHCLELNPGELDDPLLSAMERAGFASIGITIESASDPVLRGLRKGYTARDVHRAAEAVGRHRMPCAWIFLLGGPGETADTVEETLRFAANRIRPGDIAFFNMGIRLYPGTELETVARRQGLLSCAPREMLSPRYYVSPDVDPRWMEKRLNGYRDRHMNILDMDLLDHSLLRKIHRVAHGLGMRPPLWKHTRTIRRLLRLAGAYPC
ncbi:MAG: radical SAM protein [Thermodesulfobacteriota bacterium]